MYYFKEVRGALYQSWTLDKKKLNCKCNVIYNGIVVPFFMFLCKTFSTSFNSPQMEKTQNKYKLAHKFLYSNFKSS